MAIRLGPINRTEPLTDKWLDENADYKHPADAEWVFPSGDGRHRMIIKKSLGRLQGCYELELRDNTYMYYNPEVWSQDTQTVLELCRIFNFQRKI